MTNFLFYPLTETSWKQNWFIHTALLAFRHWQNLTLLWVLVPNFILEGTPPVPNHLKQRVRISIWQKPWPENGGWKLPDGKRYDCKSWIMAYVKDASVSMYCKWANLIIPDWTKVSHDTLAPKLFDRQIGVRYCCRVHRRSYHSTPGLSLRSSGWLVSLILLEIRIYLLHSVPFFMFPDHLRYSPLFSEASQINTWFEKIYVAVWSLFWFRWLFCLHSAWRNGRGDYRFVNTYFL